MSLAALPSVPLYAEPVLRAPEILVPGIADVPGLVALINTLAAERGKLFIQPIDPSTGPALLESHLAQIAASGAEIVLVARSEGEIVGLVNGTRGLHPARRGAIDVGIGVSPLHRGRGIGRALLTALEAKARNAGCHRLNLSVVTTNAPAIALYRKLGFAVEGVQHASAMIDGKPIDELLMAKQIAREISASRSPAS